MQTKQPRIKAHKTVSQPKCGKVTWLSCRCLEPRRNQPNQDERDQVKQRPDQRRQGKRNAVNLECEAPKQSQAGILKHRRVDPRSRLAKRALFLLRRLSKRGGLAQRLSDDLLLDGRVPARRQPVIKHGATALIAALVPDT